MAAPRVRVIAVAALVIVLVAVFQAGTGASVCWPAVAHAETCGESCDSSSEDAGSDLSPLPSVPSSTGSQPFLMAVGRLALARSTPPRDGFGRAIDRPPSR